MAHNHNFYFKPGLFSSWSRTVSDQLLDSGGSGWGIMSSFCHAYVDSVYPKVTFPSHKLFIISSFSYLCAPPTMRRRGVQHVDHNLVLSITGYRLLMFSFSHFSQPNILALTTTLISAVLVEIFAILKNHTTVASPSGCSTFIKDHVGVAGALPLEHYEYRSSSQYPEGKE